MKRNLILLLVLLVLGFFAFQALSTKRINSADGSDRAFTVDDIDAVYKVFVAYKNKDDITLTRNGNHWLLDDKHKVKEGAINGVLAVLEHARVKFIPSKNATKNIIKGIAKNGIKVEAFDKNNIKLTSFYIGGNTHDAYGTYFLMEHAAQPYVLELPFEESILREKFARKYLEWRDYTIFKEDDSKIVELSVEYPKDQTNSFRIIKDGDYRVESVNKNAPATGAKTNQKLVDTYLKDYRFLMAEYIENEHPRKDSISQLLPFCHISLKFEDGGYKDLKLYPVLEVMKYNSDPQEYESLKELPRFFGLASWGDFYLIQQPLIEKLLMRKSYFLEE